MLVLLMARTFLPLTGAYLVIIARVELFREILEMVPLEIFAQQVTIALLIALILFHAQLESTHLLKEERMLISAWIVRMVPSA